MKWTLVLALCLTTTAVIAEDEEEPSLAITFTPDKAVEVGHEAHITCAMNNKTIEWTYVNGSKISNLNSSRVYQTNGELHFKPTNIHDTGSYVCLTTDSTFNSTVDFIAFVMPTYFTEGMIIVGVNCGLIALFMICGIHSLIRSKQEKKRRKQKDYKLTSPT